MNETSYILVSRYLLKLTQRRGQPEDYQGADPKGQTYNIALEINGKPCTWTIEQAETATQALLQSLERLLIHADDEDLQTADSLNLVVVRESA